MSEVIIAIIYISYEVVRFRFREFNVFVFFMGGVSFRSCGFFF